MADNDISPGELARRVGEVLTRFQGLVDLIENRYVRKDILDLYKETINQALLAVQESLKTKPSKSDYDQLEKRVASLEEWNKWLARAIFVLIIAAVFGAVFGAGKLG